MTGIVLPGNKAPCGLMDETGRSVLCKKFPCELAAILTACCLAIILSACGKPVSYKTFMAQTPAYYQAIATACDDLLVRAKHNQAPLVLQGDDKMLPVCLRDLHPTKIEVHPERRDGSNSIPPYVWMVIGVTRPGFGITWEVNDYGNGKIQWELSTGADGLRTILYARPEKRD